MEESYKLIKNIKVKRSIEEEKGDIWEIRSVIFLILNDWMFIIFEYFLFKNWFWKLNLSKYSFKLHNLTSKVPVEYQINQ